MKNTALKNLSEIGKSKTRNFVKNPAKGGIPAIENKIKDIEIAAKLFKWLKQFKSDKYRLLTMFGYFTKRKLQKNEKKPIVINK